MENNELIKYEGGLVKRVGNAINITNKLLGKNHRPLRILYLDDHLLFSNPISKFILERYSESKIHVVQNGNQALEYVMESIRNNTHLDLIITDFTHPGLNGVEFSISVREQEFNNVSTIPILFITMNGDESLIKQIEEIPSAKYLPKSSSREEILLAIDNFINPEMKKNTLLQ